MYLRCPDETATWIEKMTVVTWIEKMTVIVSDNSSAMRFCYIAAFSTVCNYESGIEIEIWTRGRAIVAS